MTYAISLHDLDTAWRTPTGTALVEALLTDRRGEGQSSFEIDGEDAVLVAGTPARVQALIDALVELPLPAPVSRLPRVWVRHLGPWERVQPTTRRVCRAQHGGGRGGDEPAADSPLDRRWPRKIARTGYRVSACG